MLEIVYQVLATSAPTQDDTVLPVGGLDVDLLQALCQKTFDEPTALERLIIDAHID